LDKYKVSQREMARRTGIPQRTISARLTLLSLPLSTRAQLEAGHIGPREAILISDLPLAHQPMVMTLVVSGKLGGRALESLCILSKANPKVAIDELIKQKEQVPVPPSTQSTKEPVSFDAATEVSDSTKAGLELSASHVQDLIALIRIIKEQGAWQLEDCDLLDDDGRCKIWSWDNRESIPEGIGEPVFLEPDNWVVKPSALLCGICLARDNDSISLILNMLWNNPLTRLKERFTCDCGAKGNVAVHIKCTQCDRDTWWGSWPKQATHDR
jgi:hypothetical protein